MGIGLALAKEMAALLGGSISAENKAGGGAVFTVKLPLVQSVVIQEPNHPLSVTDAPLPLAAVSFQNEENTPGGQNGRGLPQILIIEDNADVARFIAGCLKNRFHVSFAFNGKQGVEHALEPAVALENTFLQKVRTAMEEHLDEPDYSVEDLSRAVGMSHSQLHRKMVALNHFKYEKTIRSIHNCCTVLHHHTLRPNDDV